MFIKSCIAHLCHLPAFDQLGHSLGTSGVAIWGCRGVLGLAGTRYSGSRRGIGGIGRLLGCVGGHFGASGCQGCIGG